MAMSAGELDDKCWYEKIKNSLQSSQAKKQNFPTGEGLRLEEGNWSSEIEEKNVSHQGQKMAYLIGSKRQVLKTKCNQGISSHQTWGAKTLSKGNGLK